jgi:hypothetical protein
MCRSFSVLACILVLPLVAQETKLNIVIVEGEGAVNNIKQRVAREPIVQVEDENHKPVAGAVVVFLLPDYGPGATFANGARSATVLTDTQGRAVARGLHPNQTAGKFQIHVNASYEGRTGSATISQSNAATAAAASAGGVSGKLIAILAVAGAGVAGGVYAATRGGGSTPAAPPTPTPIGISAGAPGVGPPR